MECQEVGDILYEFKKEMPMTQYLGSKRKLIPWIISKLPKCDIVCDAFSGSASVSYHLKKMKKQVISNDYLTSSYMFSKTLIQNQNTKLTNEDKKFLMKSNPDKKYEIQKHFSNIFFNNEECKFLDNLHANIINMKNEYKQSIAYSAAIRTCVQKMPGGKFRPNMLKYRDKNFIHYRPKYTRRIQDTFLDFLNQYNKAIFNNGKKNQSHNKDILELLDTSKNIDLVYFDPPYGGSGFNYQKDYFFSEYFVKDYGKINKFNGATKSYPVALENRFGSSKIQQSLKSIFELSNNIPTWVISYNNRSTPKFDDLKQTIEEFRRIDSIHTCDYRYKTGNNKGLEEILFICKA